MSRVLFVSIVTLVLSGLILHVHHRAKRTLGLPNAATRALLALMIAGSVSAFLARLLALGALGRVLGAFGGIVVLGIMISSILLWPYELVRAKLALLRWFARQRSKPLATSAPEESAPDASSLEARAKTAPSDPTRRAFLGQAAVGGALSFGFGTTMYGGLYGRHDYALEEVPIKLTRLPRALDGFTIVQLSDIHVGQYVGDPEFRSGLELVRRAKPDIVVLTGDLVDHDVNYVGELGRFVHQLRGVARRGVFAILGNHDYYTGASEVLRVLGEAGAEVLVNRHVRVGDSASFLLGGVDDVQAAYYGGHGPDIAQAFRNAEPDTARVLLSHNPEYYPRVHRDVDLMLSGHTHGGQITLFINPAELVLSHGLVRGHYVRGESQIYVNRGFGTAGPPIRVGSSPEVTKLILTA